MSGDTERVAELRAMAISADVQPVADAADLSRLSVESHIAATGGAPRVLPCLVCGTELERVARMSAQPVGALTFEAHGQYGSAVFDPMDATQSLTVNVCDGCLTSAAHQGRVSLLTYPERERPAPRSEPWAPETAEAT